MTSGQRIIGYRCIKCGKEHSAAPFLYTCVRCGSNWDVIYDYERIGHSWSREDLIQNLDRSLWRYLPLLPVREAPVDHSIQVGGTPLVSFRRIAAEYDLGRFYIKDDTRHPSGSLKDRASEIGIQHADELGFNTLVAASTGNAAASLASLAAYYGKKAVILAPASAPLAKLTQILQYGAVLCPMDSSYDEAFDLSMTVAKEYGWYCRSTGINPVLSEGKKTVALEIAEQLAWQVPDKVFVPVGDGCIIGGVYKGFCDLLELGWIERMPQIIAVQAEGSAAIVNAIQSNGKITAVEARTVADSICVNLPRDGHKAVRAVKESGGFGITISDSEILAAQKSLSKTTGIFAEPAAAATFAGFVKAAEEGKLDPGERVVILITGTGLKDIPAAQKKIEIPETISPDLREIKRHVVV